MKHVKLYEQFINEASESNVSILTDLGFTQDVKYKGGGGPIHFGSNLQPSVKDEKFYHPKMKGYSVSFMDHSWKYDGFTIWDENNNEMYYIWKQKTSNPNKRKNMEKALTKVATGMSKGRLPKSNPNQIEKHYNS